MLQKTGSAASAKGRSYSSSAEIRGNVTFSKANWKGFVYITRNSSKFAKTNFLTWDLWRNCSPSARFESDLGKKVEVGW